jgi:hypothetical protein
MSFPLCVRTVSDLKRQAEKGCGLTHERDAKTDLSDADYGRSRSELLQNFHNFFKNFPTLYTDHAKGVILAMPASKKNGPRRARDQRLLAG